MEFWEEEEGEIDSWLSKYKKDSNQLKGNLEKGNLKEQEAPWIALEDNISFLIDEGFSCKVIRQSLTSIMHPHDDFIDYYSEAYAQYSELGLAKADLVKKKGPDILKMLS